MTMPNPHVPHSNANVGGAYQGALPAAHPNMRYDANPQPVHDAMSIPGTAQGHQSLETGMSYQRKFRIGGIIFLVFAVLCWVLSAGVCVWIELLPGDHGDSGVGLSWLGVMFLLYVVPFGLMLAVCGLMLMYAARKKPR